MTRPFYFGTNFKMRQTHPESRAFVEALGRHAVVEDVCRFVIPPFTSLPGLPAVGQAGRIAIGAQNAHFAQQGAYTGEISVPMLAALDVELVMIGHAERRHDFGETDEIIARKAAAVLGSGMTLLLCVGEDLAERRAGLTETVLRRQLSSGLAAAGAAVNLRLWVAYEPVWSIGEAGLPATADDVAPAIACIRECLGELLGDRACAVPLLYGGSVNRDNCAIYAALAGIDGLFVGRGAWTVEGYCEVMARGLAAQRAR
jgi:triosephosphate isomerase